MSKEINCRVMKKALMKVELRTKEKEIGGRMKKKEKEV
jgi:hypothetical protein